MPADVTAVPAKYPTQNMIDDTLVDGYDLAIYTNNIGGKDVLEYAVIDYETVSSRKGTGRQGLFGIHSVSLNRRLISGGQHFLWPIGLDVLNDGNLVVIDSGESVANPGRVIRVDPNTGNQTLIASGGDLYWPTGGTVADNESGVPVATRGLVFVSDIGSVHAQTSAKNDVLRKIIQIDPGSGTQTVLFSTTNDFAYNAPPITNLYHPTGIEVDPGSGSLIIADSWSKTIWKLENTAGTFATELEPISIDADFLQPTHLAIQGTLASGFIFVTDGATVSPGDPYPAGTRLIHRVNPAGMVESNSEIFNLDPMTKGISHGFLNEPRGIERVPVDPLTPAP